MEAQTQAAASCGLERLRKIQEYFSKAGRLFCACCLIAIIISTSLSVFLRYVFFLPLNFSDSLSVLLLTWMVFVGSGLAIASGEHVFVDYFLSRFPANLKNFMAMLSAVLVSIFLIVISYYGYFFSWMMRDSTDPLVFGISMMIPYLSVPVGATYSLLQLWLTVFIIMMSQKKSLESKAS